MIWLLRIDLGSAIWYLSEKDAAPVDQTGATLAHDPTLGEPSVAYDAIPGTDSAVGDFEAQVSFLAPVSVSEFEANGWPLSKGRAELSRWTPGTPYEARERVAIGDVVLDGLPIAGEEISVSLVPSDPSDLQDFPPAKASISTDTIAAVAIISAGTETADTFHFLDSSDGLVYPWVFGRPGLRVDATGATVATPATPALLVFDALNSPWAIIAGHQTREVDRIIYNPDLDNDVTDPTYSIPSEFLRDARGRLLSILDVSGLVGFTYDSSLQLYVAGWSSGIRWDDGDEIRGLGDVVLYLLRNCDGGRVHDLGAWQATAPLLNRIEVGGYLDEVVSPWDVVASDLLALYPRCVALWSPDGYQPVVFDDASPDLGPELTEGIDFELVEDARPEEVTEGGITTVRVEYSHYPVTDVYLDSVTFGPGVTDATEEDASEVARRAFAVVGQRSSYTLTSAWLWRQDSAGVVARDWLDLLAEPLVRVRGQLTDPDQVRALPVGAGVRVTSSTLGWTARPCWVSGHWYEGSLAGLRFLGRPRIG